MVWADVNPLFARVRELTNSVKSAIQDLTNAEKARRRNAKVCNHAEREHDRQKKTATAAELKVPFFERLAASDCVVDVPSQSFKDFAPLRALPEGPMLVRDIPWSKEVLKAISPFKVHYDAFKPVFNSSKAKRATGHGSRPIQDLELQKDMAANLLGDFFLPGVVHPLPVETMEAARVFVAEKKGEKHAVAHGCLPSVFGMRSHLEVGGPEVGGMGCVRIAHEGSRSFACCHASHLFDFMTQGGNTFLPEAVTVQSSYDFVRSMVAEDFKRMFNNGKTLWRATVGPHDALIVPCGMFAFDSVFGAEVLGRKISIALRTKTTAADLHALLTVAQRREATKEIADIRNVVQYCGLEEEVLMLLASKPKQREKKTLAASAPVASAVAAAAGAAPEAAATGAAPEAAETAEEDANKTPEQVEESEEEDANKKEEAAAAEEDAKDATT